MSSFLDTYTTEGRSFCFCFYHASQRVDDPWFQNEQNHLYWDVLSSYVVKGTEMFYESWISIEELSNQK